MNILIVSQAIQQWYIGVMREALDKEYNIDLITGSKICVDGVNVIPSPKHDPSGLISRFKVWIKHYLFVKKWLKANNKKYDAVLLTSNPPINSMIGVMLKRKLKAKVIYMNWDLYPQVIENQIDNPIANIICKFWHYINNKNYPKIDKMLTIADHLAEEINKPLKNKIEVNVLPIVTDVNKMKPVEKANNPFCIQNNLTDKTVVLYSGKMGLGHNIEIMLNAATLLMDREDIVFVFIGQGQKKALVEEHIAKYAPKNVMLFPLQPSEMFPYSMASGDIAVVSQEKKMAKLFMPSKTYDCMAVGQAVVGICSGDDDLSDLIEKYEIGEVVSTNNANELAEKIENLVDNKDLLLKYKANARKCAEDNYSIKSSINGYKKLFSQLLK